MSIPPVVNLTNPEFTIPGGSISELYTAAARIDPAGISSGVVGGTGVFDIFMTGLSAHLKSEYDKGRITGAEYAKAFVALTEAAMSSATQFMLQRETVFWQATQGQIAAVTAKVQHEVVKAQYSLVREQIEVQRAQTLDTRTDTLPVAGVLGKQKDLYAQQVTSYQRDIEIKASKLFTDAWITMKSIDEGLAAPTNFSNASLDGVLTTLKTNVSLGS